MSWRFAPKDGMERLIDTLMEEQPREEKYEKSMKLDEAIKR